MRYDKILDEIVVVMVMVMVIILLSSFSMPDKKRKAREVKKWRKEQVRKERKAFRYIKRYNRKVTRHEK